MNKNTIASISKRVVCLLLAFTLIITSVSLTLQSSSVFAVENGKDGKDVKCDLEFYMTNNVSWYNPCADLCSTSASPSGTGVKIAALKGQNNAEKMYNFWMEAGLSSAQASGVLGSMWHEGHFSPFIQEFGKPWPTMGWGIAQFTHDPGQRGNAKAYVLKEIGESLFNQYYKADFSGDVKESNGFVPEGVPVDVNDKFLLAQLNYLLEHIKGLNPNNVRRDAYQSHFNKSFDSSGNMFDHLKTLATPSEAAVAWTYLYEWPGDIKSTAMQRAKTAEKYTTMFNGGSTANTCGSTVAGNMDLAQAKSFMETYKKIDSGDPNGDKKYLSAACTTLTDNCVTFVSYFVNKYTSAKFGISNGAMVVNATLAKNPEMKSGTKPEPFSIFAVKKGVTRCDWNGDGKLDDLCGHTGIVLGVDEKNNKVIVGEAAYCDNAFTAAREYPLDKWSNGEYSYAYLGSYMKGEVK